MRIQELKRTFAEMTEKEKRSEAAALMGSIKTTKKANSSRENGKLGGRPKRTANNGGKMKTFRDIIWERFWFSREEWAAYQHRIRINPKCVCARKTGLTCAAIIRKNYEKIFIVDNLGIYDPVREFDDGRYDNAPEDAILWLPRYDGHCCPSMGFKNKNKHRD